MTARRRRRTPAPTPKRTSRKADARFDRFELRARAQTAQIANPGKSIREIAMLLGEPYVVVLELLDPTRECTTGLSQYRYPEHEDEAATG